eukprot:365609-Chlamydomonas_euryale.AAC.4
MFCAAAASSQTTSPAASIRRVDCTFEKVAQHSPLSSQRALDRVMRPTCWSFLKFRGRKVFDSLPPGLPVQSTFRRRC